MLSQAGDVCLTIGFGMRQTREKMQKRKMQARDLLFSQAGNTCLRFSRKNESVAKFRQHPEKNTVHDRKGSKDMQKCATNEV